jgi:16S rRNA (guanine(1405)-N(7))-methyltransferase
MTDLEKLESLVATVQQKSKYRTICADFIRRIGSQELAKRASLKEAIKSTCSKLHQMGGAFFENHPDFPLWLSQLEALPQDINSTEIKQYCMDKMQAHASTNERLPIIEDFYQRCLERVAPIHSLLDLGCGLNPLALPWMPLGGDPMYQGVDIFSDMTEFDQRFLQHTHIRGRVNCADFLGKLPKQHFKLALALKIIPLIDQLDKEHTRQWLENIPADQLLVSFPIFSLSGKGKGMIENYTSRFNKLTENGNWKIERFEFSTELAFLLHH